MNPRFFGKRVSQSPRRGAALRASPLGPTRNPSPKGRRRRGWTLEATLGSSSRASQRTLPRTPEALPEEISPTPPTRTPGDPEASPPRTPDSNSEGSSRDPHREPGLIRGRAAHPGASSTSIEGPLGVRTFQGPLERSAESPLRGPFRGPLREGSNGKGFRFEAFKFSMNPRFFGKRVSQSPRRGAALRASPLGPTRNPSPMGRRRRGWTLEATLGSSSRASQRTLPRTPEALPEEISPTPPTRTPGDPEASPPRTPDSNSEGSSRDPHREPGLIRGRAAHPGASSTSIEGPLGVRTFQLTLGAPRLTINETAEETFEAIPGGRSWVPGCTSRRAGYPEDSSIPDQVSSRGDTPG